MAGSNELFERISKIVQENPKKIVISETETNNRYSYGDFLTSEENLARFLQKPQTILLALNGSILDSIVWITALLHGHLLIPISPYLTKVEYDELVLLHHPDIIIAEKPLGSSHTAQFFSPKKLQQIITKRASTQLPRVQDGKVFLATSGSTGKPKGMTLTASQIIYTAKAIQNSHRITEDDRGLTPLPFYHVNAPVVSLITTLLANASLIIAPKYSTSHFWEWVKKYDPTWISLVPTMVAMLLTTKKPLFLKKSHIRFIRTASAPLPVENLKRFEKQFGIPLIETYGISEAASTIAANPLPPHIHVAGSVGLPIGVHMLICDPKTSKEVQQGVIGEVCIKGQSVITAYEKGQNKDAFHNGWFHTGDLGYFDKNNFLHLTGRIKDIIIRGGENISPREIEEVIIAFPGVVETAVVGQEDPIYGEKVVAFVVIKDKVEKIFVEKLFAFLQKQMSPQKLPTDIYILNELPRGKTGKIDKVTLRKFIPSQKNKELS